MQLKNLLSTIALLLINFAQFSYGNRPYHYNSLSGPDHGDKFKVQSIPDALLEHVDFKVIQPNPWNSPDWNNNQSNMSGWQQCKEHWKGVGQGFKIAGIGIGKGTVFVAQSMGKGVVFFLEGMCDCADWAGDIIDTIFDPEEPLEVRSNKLKQQQAQQHTNAANNIPSTPETANAEQTPSAPAHAAHYITSEKSMIEQQQSFAAYEEELSLHMSQLEHTPYEHMYDRAAKRLDAFKAHKDNQTCYKETYTLSQEITPYMRRHSLDLETFEVCHGTIIQHQLHQEIIEILTTNCEIERIFTEHQQTALFTDLVAEGADLARELNQQGDVVHGFRIADYCGWLNEAEYPRLANFVKQSAGIVVGTVEGGANIVTHTYHMVRHPVDTVKALAYVLGQTSKFLFHGIQEAGPLAFHLSFHGTPEGYQIHPHFANDINAIKNFYNQTAQNLAQLPPEEQTRKTMAFFTELFFTGKFMGQVAKIKRAATASLIKPGVLSLADKLQLYKYKALTQTYTRIASTIANTQDIIKTTCKSWLQPPAYCYEFVIDQAGNGRWLYDINPSFLEGAVAEYTNLVPIEKIQGILSRTSMTEIIRSTIQENAIELLPGIAEKSITTMIEYAAERPMLMTLDRKRAGFGDMKNKFLKFKMDHLFEAKINGNHFDGLHHDYLGHYENNGILQLECRVEGKLGEYGGKPFWNGIGGYDKTFFPKHWTRKEVIENIYEAYDDFIANGAKYILQENGKYQITGQTRAGMKIRMIIDPKCNLKSAYPII